MVEVSYPDDAPGLARVSCDVCGGVEFVPTTKRDDLALRVIIARHTGHGDGAS